MAGWGAYTKALLGTKHVTACSIHGLDGAVWAAEGAPKVSVSLTFLFKIRYLRLGRFSRMASLFLLQAAEAKALAGAFKDPSPLRSGGMMAGGIKHIALACDADVSRF